jgi:hypothetical protein
VSALTDVLTHLSVGEAFYIALVVAIGVGALVFKD